MNMSMITATVHLWLRTQDRDMRHPGHAFIE